MCSFILCVNYMWAQRRCRRYSLRSHQHFNGKQAFSWISAKCCQTKLPLPGCNIKNESKKQGNAIKTNLIRILNYLRAIGRTAFPNHIFLHHQVCKRGMLKVWSAKKCHLRRYKRRTFSAIAPVLRIIFPPEIRPQKHGFAIMFGDLEWSLSHGYTVDKMDATLLQIMFSILLYLIFFLFFSF